MGMRLRVIIRLAESVPLRAEPTITRDLSRAQSKGPVEGPSQRAQSKSPVERPSQGAQSEEQAKAVLIFLENTELSASEIVIKLGLGSKTGAFKRLIKDLLEKQLIEYTIPDKPSSRLQKYRLTKAGKALLGS
jgi:ATP-dependent DNA helicase RecG